MSPSQQMLPAIDVVGIILAVALTTTTILFPAAVNAQLDCSEAPTTALKIICEQLHRWDKNAREAPPVEEKIPLPPAIPGLPTPLIAGELAPVAATIYQCMDLGCLCSYMGGNGQQGSNACSLANGQPLRKALRREYRMLSDEERARFHAAMLAIKRSGEYDRIAAIHSQFATSGSAHSGPGFLPWHREFIKRFEIALRQVDPSVSLPYWDSTLDGALPTPGDSMLFSADFMGGSDGMGNLVTGGFGGWRTLTGRANVLRRVGADGSCFREQDIQWFMNQNQIEMVLGFSAPQRGCTIPTNWNLLEYTHGNIHVFVGGDMVDQSTSANDPIFFIHHSFVDMIWEMWRLGRQSRNDREILYPMDMQLCAAPQHFGNARMRPFEPWNNIDGLSNKYTDNLYEYAPRPTCQAGPNCGSKYLFCDRSHGGARCAAKIRPGGNCMGFVNGEDVCMNGQCQGGRCVQTQQPVATTPRPIPVTPTSPLRPTTACYNEHECCSVWSTKGECQRNPKYMNAWCKASCRQCQPDYNLGDECSNRHPQCGQWSGQGECQRNQFWMTENCRQSCGRCQVTRAQVCSGGTGSQTNQNRVTVAPPRQNAKCTSPGCFNENICCQLWGLMGECRKNPGWMTCNCRVACGMCIPQDYNYGTCTDYHRQCRQWAMQGECQKNGWMLENCKQSCQTCVSFWELRQLCRGSRSGRRKRSTLEFSSIGFPPSIEAADVDERPGRLLRDVEAAMALMGGGINATDRGINMDMQAPADGPAPPSGQSSSEKVQKLLQHQEELPESSGMPGGSA